MDSEDHLCKIEETQGKNQMQGRVESASMKKKTSSVGTHL